jgi:hypothetical protein
LTAQSDPWMICSHLQVHSSFILTVNSLFATVPPFHSAFYFIFKIDITYFMLMRSFPDTQSTCRQRFCWVGLDSMMSGYARIWFTLQPFWDWHPAFSCPQPVDWSSFGTLKAGFWGKWLQPVFSLHISQLTEDCVEASRWPWPFPESLCP